MSTQTQTLQILVVDDDMLVLSMVSDTLRAEGYEVQTALDGSHGLQKIATTDRAYDLIIADGRMPHLDGWRFIMQARAGGFKGKIIVFSAWLDEDERERYKELNIDALIDKPPKTGQLLAAVKKIAARV